MANRRTFWACEGLGTATHGSGTLAPSTYEFVPGIQSLGMSTNFNLEQIFQLGQLEIYQDLEEVPDIELTVERVMDQHALLYNRGMAHVAFLAGASTTTITGDQNNQVDIGFVVNLDTNSNIGDANALAFAYMSGMFVSSATFNFGADGYFTENITLVGNHKQWDNEGGAADTMAGSPAVGATDTGNVAKRQKLFFETLPAPLTTLAGTVADVAIVSANVSVDFGREEMNILGQRQPYHRYVNFPVEVTCDIEAYVTDVVDMVVNASPESDNTTETGIRIEVENLAVASPVATGAGAALHVFELGSAGSEAKNRLQSVTWNGLDTGGTNATITYSYRNFNFLKVITPASRN